LGTYWYENGQKQIEVTLKDGKEDGLFTEWYENGQKESEVTYKNGELISEECWDEDGNECQEKLFDELVIEDIIVGEGTMAEKYSIITVNYTGWLEDGTKFDSSLNPGREPYRFTVGAGHVIQGWDQGIPGMKIGGKRKLTIPPSMGYGNRAMGAIPANSVLIFEVDLLIVE
jgi:FKBP-type peptidyl-prolyl cis-trans isomerase